MTRTLNVNEAAELIGVSKNTIYAMARRGDLPCIRIGNRYIFTAESLEAWLNKSVDQHAVYNPGFSASTQKKRE